MHRARPIVLLAGPEDEGRRLDRFIRERSRVFSRIRARDLLAAGGVTLNGKRVKVASRPVRAGDRVEVFPLPEERRSGAPEGMAPFRVVHEDPAVIVVDKAPGILVQPTSQGDRGTLLDLLARHLKKRNPDRSPYLGLLHRIDRETSGLLLFSRRGSANRILAEQFRTHTIAREYLALVRGTPAAATGTISDRLSRSAAGSRRGAAGAGEGGKAAVTHYATVEPFARATLLSITLETGRTHQIRIHLSHRGHPVVGDKVYGSAHRLPREPLLDSFPRQALHASRLGFTHPLTGAWLHFHAPLPEDFDRLLRALRKESGGVESTPGSGDD
ncbi:MAG TPA: RluA family pseudouridine synthase [Candidatus Polarisedimenticolia bacterium]|jgi:23S rRNA pseudouridine1911/1915/1917 synthase|nr:RluA family pseudouridine synthase [Candidatus Polarisedimenticolia bacterium]